MNRATKKPLTPGASFPRIVLDRRSFVPYHLQISHQLREIIRSGTVQVGQSFWSEVAFAEKLGVSKMTVRQAFQALRSEGLLLIEKGKRPLVGSGHIVKNFNELRGFTEEMMRRGLHPSTRVLRIAIRDPDPETASALRLAEGAKVYELRRLRSADDEVVGLETVRVPAELFPGLEKQDLENQSLYFTLENVYSVKIDWSEEEFEAIAAQKEDARLLQVRTGFPLFCMRRTVYSTDQKPVEHGLSVFRSDRYVAVGKSRRL